MNSTPNNGRPKGFLLMCGCLVLLAQYWLFVGPLWKYGSYTFLGLMGGLGLIVALTARKGYRSMGVVVVVAAFLLAIQTYSEKAGKERAQMLHQTEERLLEAIRIYREQHKP